MNDNHHQRNIFMNNNHNHHYSQHNHAYGNHTSSLPAPFSFDALAALPCIKSVRAIPLQLQTLTFPSSGAPLPPLPPLGTPLQPVCIVFNSPNHAAAAMAHHHHHNHPMPSPHLQLPYIQPPPLPPLPLPPSAAVHVPELSSSASPETIVSNAPPHSAGSSTVRFEQSMTPPKKYKSNFASSSTSININCIGHGDRFQQPQQPPQFAFISALKSSALCVPPTTTAMTLKPDDDDESIDHGHNQHDEDDDDDDVDIRMKLNFDAQQQQQQQSHIDDEGDDAEYNPKQEMDQDDDDVDDDDDDEADEDYMLDLEDNENVSDECHESQHSKKHSQKHSKAKKRQRRKHAQPRTKHTDPRTGKERYTHSGEIEHIPDCAHDVIPFPEFDAQGVVVPSCIAYADVVLEHFECPCGTRVFHGRDARQQFVKHWNNECTKWRAALCRHPLECYQCGLKIAHIGNFVSHIFGTKGHIDLKDKGPFVCMVRTRVAGDSFKVCGHTSTTEANLCKHAKDIHYKAVIAHEFKFNKKDGITPDIGASAVAVGGVKKRKKKEKKTDKKKSVSDEISPMATGETVTVTVTGEQTRRKRRRSARIRLQRQEKEEEELAAKRRRIEVNEPTKLHNMEVSTSTFRRDDELRLFDVQQFGHESSHMHVDGHVFESESDQSRFLLQMCRAAQFVERLDIDDDSAKLT